MYLPIHTPRPYLTFIVGTDHSVLASGSSTDQFVLFGYAQMALNADATFEFRPHDCDKGLQPTILLCLATLLERKLVLKLDMLW